MLAQRYRFHSRGGVKYVYSHGESVRGAKISLVYLKNSRSKYGRFAVIVSKKVLKSAVGRNRIRRRIYEVLRAEMPGIKQPYDVLVTVYSKDVMSMPFGELKESVQDLLRQANII